MKGSSVATAVAAATAGLSSLAAAAEPKVVAMDFSKTRYSSSAMSDFKSLRRLNRRFLNKRASEQTLVSDGTLYYLNISVGSPAQSMGVYVDTGSSDLWLPSTASGQNFCEEASSNSAGCGTLGGFDPTRSSSFTELERMGEFSIRYGDGTRIVGDYFTDNLNIGDIRLTNVTMALATDGRTQYSINGIMGVGYNTNEAPALEEEGGFTPYPNVINAMMQQGAINSLAYSLYMNDASADRGTIIFGGVDTAKYTGNLVVIPLVPDPLLESFQAGGGGSGGGSGNAKRVVPRQSSSSAIDAFFVDLTQIGSANGGKTYSLGSSSVPVLLDSGTSAVYLPEQTVIDIWSDLGVNYDQSYGPLIRCQATSSAPDLTFTFSGQTIRVPINQMAIPFTAENLQGVPAPSFSDGSEACQFGMFPSQDVYILGDTFISSSYIVYDISNNQVALAQSNFNATSSNIVEISSTIPADSTVTDSPSATSARISAAITNTADLGAGSGAGSLSIPSSLFFTAETTRGTLATSTGGANALLGSAPSNGLSAIIISVLTSVLAWL